MNISCFLFNIDVSADLVNGFKSYRMQNLAAHICVLQIVPQFMFFNVYAFNSLVDDVLGSSGSGASPVTRTGSFSATAGSPVRVSVKMPYVGAYSCIYNQVAINTGSSGSGSRALSVNTGVPSSGTISFSDLYSSIGS